MRTIKMQYRGMELPVNPRSVSVARSKKTAKSTIPFRRTRVSEICTEPAVVQGSGIFTGEGAKEQADRLQALFSVAGSAWLFSPVLPPARMYFTALTVQACATTEGIEFSFTFTEDTADRKRRPFSYTYAAAGENLFDIAARTGADVSTLCKRNRYRDLFSVEEGDKVWIE